MKHLFCGVLAGALLATGALRAFVRGSVGGEEERSLGAAVEGRPDASTSSPPSEIRASLEKATARIEKLRAEVASLKSARAAAASPGSDVAANRSSLVRLYLENLDDYIGNRWLTVPANEEMFVRLQTLIRRLAADLGLGLDEVGASPEGFAALAREVLDGLVPALDKETRAAVEEELAEARKKWDEYAAERGPMTRLERGGRTEEMYDELTEALEDRLKGRATDAVEALDTLWVQSQPVWTGSRHHTYFESQDEAVTRWTQDWGDGLKLDAAQKASLKPIVENYVRTLAEQKVGRTPGQFYNDGKAVLDLMVGTQKKMLEMLGLTPEQAEALRNQVDIYDYEIQPRR